MVSASIYISLYIRNFRSSEQLFVCHGGQQKARAVSKQRLAHWIVDAVALAYRSQGEPCPLGVRAHSTWSVASSYALANCASLADICRAAGWVKPSLDFTIPVLSQSLPVCWVTGNSGKSWPMSCFLRHSPHFAPPVQFPGQRKLVEFLRHPRQSNWAEQSDARPSTSVSSPGFLVSP